MLCREQKRQKVFVGLVAESVAVVVVVVVGKTGDHNLEALLLGRSCRSQLLAGLDQPWARSD